MMTTPYRDRRVPYALRRDDEEARLLGRLEQVTEQLEGIATDLMRFLEQRRERPKGEPNSRERVAEQGPGVDHPDSGAPLDR